MILRTRGVLARLTRRSLHNVLIAVRCRERADVMPLPCKRLKGICDKLPGPSRMSVSCLLLWIPYILLYASIDPSRTCEYGAAGHRPLRGSHTPNSSRNEQPWLEQLARL